jgi:hypothetical protein
MTEQKRIHPADLVGQLAARMRAASLDWEKSKIWTETLKDSLRNLLETEGTNVTEVLYSCRDSDRHEFLLDVVVWDRSDGEGLRLAVESEWSQNLDEVTEDFWKLLVVKAPVKLMIFACNNRPRKFSQEKVWEKLSECLLRYRDHTKHERYIFMDYARPPGRKAWWIEIPADGKLEAVPERNWLEFE